MNLIRKYISYCNKPLPLGASFKEIFIKGIARAIPMGVLLTLFGLCIYISSITAFIALGVCSIILIYLLGLI